MPTAYIGLGANLPSTAGPPESTLAAVVSRLESLGRLVARSSLYSTKPVGFSAQPRFVNAVVALESDLTPRALLDGLLAVEREFGRDRAASFPNGPRTLDLDILLYGNQIVAEPNLEIPHPRLADRLFVLVPLAEIAAHTIDPASGRTVGQLLSSLRAATCDQADAVLPLQTQLWLADPGVASGDAPPHVRS
jgi:2-amino-4-hydroxy-6-hydroxymethyldihydropteridine diphosphokinase